jgi:hypothetical protein
LKEFERILKMTDSGGIWKEFGRNLKEFEKRTEFGGIW